MFNWETAKYDTSGSGNTGVTSVGSLAFNTGNALSKPNMFATVGVGWQDTLGLGPTISGITIGAVNCTFYKTNSTTVNGFINEVWYAYAPPSGVSTCTITWTQISVAAAAGCSHWYNVNQAAGLGVAVVGTGTVSPVTKNITGKAANNMAVDVTVAERLASTLTLTVSGGGLSNYNVIDAFPSANIISASGRIQSAVGTVTRSWTMSTNKAWAIILFEILASNLPPSLNVSQAVNRANTF